MTTPSGAVVFAGDDPDQVDDVRRRLSAGGVVAVAGGRGSGRTTVLDALAAALPTTWERLDVDRLPTSASTGPGQRVLVVDDLHDLDPSALDALRASHARGMPLLTSITDETRLDVDVRTLLLDAKVVVPPPMTDADIAATVAARLGAAPDDTGRSQLARACGRRPGLLLRLLDGLTARIDGDVAVLAPEITGTDGALAWRRERLPTSAVHRAARLVGRGEGLRRDQLAAVVGTAALEDAVADGLLAIDGDGMRIRDPLVAAVVAGPDRVTHGTDDASALLQAVGDAGTDLRDRWRAEAGADVAPDTRAAVVRSLLDEGRPRLALRVAGRGRGEPVVEAATALALTAVGRGGEAARLLAGLLHGTEPAVTRQAAVRLADHRFFRELDPDGALEALTHVDPAEDPVAREGAMLGMLVRSAIGTAGDEPPLEEEPTDPPPVVRLVADLRAVLAGRVDDPDRVAVLPPDASPAGLPLHQRSLANRSLALLHALGVPAARPAVDDEVDAAVASGRPGALALAIGGRAQLDQLAGHLTSADRRYRAALLRAAVDDEAGVTDVLRAARATTLAELGDLEAAAAVLGPAVGSPPADLRTRMFGAGARVRVLTVIDRDAAIAAAVEDIAVGRETGHHVWAALGGLHAARVGLAVDVAEEVARTAAATTGLAQVAAAAVHALAGEDRAEQRATADDLARFGLRRVAAELLLQPGATRPDQRRAAALLDGLGPPRPELGVPIEPLTPREEQVARLAANGSSSREVAARLGLSVRTVDNHLRRVYRKLGLGGREGLAAMYAAVE